MKQPDLGKKIAELRQARGMTQEELAEKCKLSTRTIQRIELAEVMPRSYTVKAIFTCLGYDYYHSDASQSFSLDVTVSKVNKQLKRFYRYILDLFNLKTHTMKKVMILLVPFLTVLLVLLLSSARSDAQDSEEIRAEFYTASSNAAFSDQFNNGQIDSVCQRYLYTACYMPDQYPTVAGRDKINAYYQQLYDRGVRFTEVRSTYKIISDSIAIDRGTWTVTVNTISVSGNYFTQWHYVNGEWMIENEMSRAAFIPGDDDQGI